MLNNFCFHVYAQKSLFIGENVMFFLTASYTPAPLALELKIKNNVTEQRSIFKEIKILVTKRPSFFLCGNSSDPPTEANPGNQSSSDSGLVKGQVSH